MDPITLAKDTVSQAALIWATVQVLKGLIRWRAATDPPNELILAVAGMLSVLVAAIVIPPSGMAWDDWLLSIGVYGMVILLPQAMAAHEVAGIGKGALVAGMRRRLNGDVPLRSTPIDREPTVPPGDEEGARYLEKPPA